MSRPKKSDKNADYSLTLNNLYIALYERSSNPYTNAGTVFGFKSKLTGEDLDKLLNQSRSEEAATKLETLPFMAAVDYSGVLNLYSKKTFIHKGSQKLFFIAHLGGWRSAKVTLSQKTDVIFNGNTREDGGVRAEFYEDLASWKCFINDLGDYEFFRIDDFIGRTQSKKAQSIAEHIVSCNHHLIDQYCQNKNQLKQVIADFAERMMDDEKKRSEGKDNRLKNLYEDHQREVIQLKECLEILILAYENSDNAKEKDWFLARALAYLVIGAMLRESMSCELIEENFVEYIPGPDKTSFGEDVTGGGDLEKPKTALSVPERFWQAGKTWYEEARKPGVRFHSLDIVNHILPSAGDKPAGSEYSFPFRASGTDENAIQCSRFSELLRDKSSVYHKGHFMLIGEGGIGKTTTLMSAMQDAYEGRDIYKGESVIPLFIELSLAPDSQDSHAYDGTSSSVIHRLIHAMLQRKESRKDYSDLLRECMNDENSNARDTVHELLTSVTGDETRYVLLIDGLNEVSPEPFTGRSSSAQWRILQEIREIIDKYSNVTVILTGRQGAFIDHPSFHPFYLRGLVWEEIKDYLREKGKTDEEISLIRNGDKGLLKVLSIPMFLTMYVLLRDTEGITTRGELLKIFFHERFERRKKEYDILYRQGDISERIDQDEEQSVSGKMTRGKITLPVQWMFLDILIPEIAAKMERAHDFRISEKDVCSLLESLFKEQDSLYCGKYKEFSDICFSEQLQGEDLEDVISDFTDVYRQKAARYSAAFLKYCESSMGILYREGEKTYGFVHQHIRDYFAAVCNVNRMKIAYTAFQEDDTVSARAVMQQYDKEPIDPILMVYIGEYLGEHHNAPHCSEDAEVSSKNNAPKELLKERQLISNLFDIYRGTDQENAYGVYNLVEILKRVRKDLSGSDFHDLDLRRCHFYNVHLDSGPETIFLGAIINAKNWFPEGHSDNVCSVSFSPDGNCVVTASDDGTARIWDSRTGELLHTLEGHSGGVNSAVFSRDGNRVATASFDGTARIWDSWTGDLLHTLEGHSENMTSVSFSPDGKFVVTTASSDKTARIWDSRTGEFLSTLDGHSGEVNSVVFSRDGSRVVTASSDKTARIWDSRTGEFLSTLEGHSDEVNSAVFSRDGSRVVTASSDKTARIWDSHTGELLHTLRGHSDRVNNANFNEDESQVVTASDDKTARIWDSRTGELIHTLQKKFGEDVKKAVFSPDGGLLATESSWHGISVWNVQTGKLLYDLMDDGNVSFSPDGSMLVTSYRTSARIWDSRRGDLLHSLIGHSLDGSPFFEDSGNFSPDGRFVITVYGNKARIWDSKKNILQMMPKYHNIGVASVGISPDGNYVVIASDDKIARIMDIRTGEMLHTLEGHSSGVNNASFNEDGSQVVTASWDKTARIWDSRTGKLLHILEGNSEDMTSVGFSPDGNCVVTAFYDGTVRIWDSRTGRLLHKLEDHTEWVNSAVFSRDGSRVVTASNDGTACIWDVKTGELLQALKGHIHYVNSASFSPDGSQVITASADFTANIWNSRTGGLLYKLRHLGNVVSASFNYDGSRVVTASWDKTACIWNSQTGKLLQKLEGHSAWVTSASFNREGNLVVTVSSDNTVIIWDVNTGKAIKTLYNVPGLYISGINCKRISTRSKMTDKQKEIFRQYGALI